MKNKKNASYYLIGLILILCILIVYVGIFVKGIKPIKNTNSSYNIVNNNVISGSNVESSLKKDDNIDLKKDTNHTKIETSKDVNKELNALNQTTENESSAEALTDTFNLENIDKLPAKTILDRKLIGDLQVDNCFYYKDITDDIKLRINGKSYKEDCTVPYEELKYVRVLYYGFDKETHIGEIIVNTAIADDMVDIFKELYHAKYPIEQITLVDEYDADDNTSMAANNTSSFNYRTVPGATHLSKHALGLAIDVNPLYNPYIQYNEDETIILPIEGTQYADRNLDNPYYIRENDVCYNAFTKRGFTWGGFWETEPDYQHFQKTIK
jgi:hypothetical protein